MPKTIRNILATLAGIAVAFAVVLGIEMLGHAVYPPPGGLDINNAEQMRTYIGTLTIGAIAFVLAAWWLGAFFGGLIAGMLSRGRAKLTAAIVGAFVFAATVANLLLIPHPMLFAGLGLIGIVGASWLAGKLASAWTQ